MKVISTVLLGLALSACGPPQPTDSVASLSANPERLQEVQRRCKDGSIDTAACRAASEAVRQKFLKSEPANYTPTSPPKQ